MFEIKETQVNESGNKINANLLRLANEYLEEEKMNTKFEEVFNHFKSIEFNTKWCNGTGYMDNAVKGDDAPVLSVGEVRSFTDNKNRRGFVIGTPRGNIVVFQRYTGGERKVWVINASRAASAMLGPDYDSAFTEEEALKLVGFFPDCFSVVDHLNIGKRMNSFLVG